MYEQNIILDWNLISEFKPGENETVFTLCENDGYKFYKVQWIDKTGQWTESPFVVAWAKLPAFPELSQINTIEA